MKITFIIVGGILCLFGLADLVSSFMEIDLWGGVLGIQLPEIIWKFSAYIEMLVGYLLFQAGISAAEDATEA